MGQPLKYTTEDFIDTATMMFGDHLSYEKAVYRGKRQRLIVTCTHHGEFDVNPLVFLMSTHGCANCARDETKERFIRRSLELHGDRYDYSLVEVDGYTDPVTVVCKTHGAFETSIYGHSVRGNQCPKCSRERDRTCPNEWIKKVKKIHKGKYDYSKAVYIHGKLPVTIICPHHGEFTQPARSHYAGHGCKQCHIQFVARSNKERFVRQAKEKHGVQYDYSRVVFLTTKEKVEILCRKHGPFWVTPNAHASSGAGCPRCIESKGERRIRLFLGNHKVRFIQEYRIEPFRYRYDFFLPDYNCVIEHHGGQHYMPVKRFGGEKAFKQCVQRDKNKKHIAKRKGITYRVTNYKMMNNSKLEKNLTRILLELGHSLDH